VDPQLAALFRERAKVTRKKLIRWIVIVDAIVFAAILYYFFGRG